MSHTTLATTGPYVPLNPVGQWRYWYDRVSQVLAYQNGPRAKLESDRAGGAFNGIPEQS